MNDDTPFKWQEPVVSLDPKENFQSHIHLWWGHCTGKTWTLVRLMNNLLDKGYEVHVVTPTSYQLDSIFERENRNLGGRYGISGRESSRHAVYRGAHSEEQDYRLSENRTTTSRRKVLLLDEYVSDNPYVEGLVASGAFDMVVGTGTNSVVSFNGNRPPKVLHTSSIEAVREKVSWGPLLDKDYLWQRLEEDPAKWSRLWAIEGPRNDS